MDYAEKKEKLASLIEEAADDRGKKDELMAFILELTKDVEFSRKDLYKSILPEIGNYFDELSRKELKQRASMIRTFLE